MLVAGDPVGPPEAIPALLHEVVALARRHGLALGAARTVYPGQVAKENQSGRSRAT
jgi:hypothetical protein